MGNQRNNQQAKQCNRVHQGATDTTRDAERAMNGKGLFPAGRCADMQSSASSISKAGDRIRTGDVQLGKLAFYR